jgi:hypothetical protein
MHDEIRRHDLALERASVVIDSTRVVTHRAKLRNRERELGSWVVRAKNRSGWACVVRAAWDGISLLWLGVSSGKRPTASCREPEPAPRKIQQQQPSCAVFCERDLTCLVQRDGAESSNGEHYLALTAQALGQAAVAVSHRDCVTRLPNEMDHKRRAGSSTAGRSSLWSSVCSRGQSTQGSGGS